MDGSLTANDPPYLGDQLFRVSKNVSTSSVLSDIREFLLLFFGAGWSLQSQTVAVQLRTLLNDINEDGNRVFEVVYISNDESEEEYFKFYDTFFGQNSQGANGCSIPFNDPRILKLREQYQIDCVPVVVVLDRN